jgi:hypothetical protein
MHHHRIPARHGHYILVNLVALKGPTSGFQLSLLSHARPHIGIDHIRRPHRLLHVMSDNDPSSILPGRGRDLHIWLVALWTSEGKRERELLRRLHPGMGHIVSVADKSDLQTF